MGYQGDDSEALQREWHGDTLGRDGQASSAFPAGFGADVAPAPAEYRDIPYVGSRNVIWVVAQLHCCSRVCVGCPILLGSAKSWPGGGSATTNLPRNSPSSDSLFHNRFFGGIYCSADRVLSQADELSPNIPVFIVYCSFSWSRPTLYLYWYGWDDAVRRQEDLSIFLGSCSTSLHFYHDHTELLGHVQSSPVVIAEGRIWPGLGRDRN